ncbi:sialyltransferase, partial [Avibacterium paragallinarum]
TTWEKDKEKRLNNAKLQTEILESFIKPNGKFYLGDDIKIFFKGHPKGDDINDYIISKTGAEKIPANIPFEVLMMTNSLPDYVGGIMSTVYFSLSPKNIDKVIFLGSEKIKNENDAKSQTLSKLMLMLNVITPEQIFFEEMPNPINF